MTIKPLFDKVVLKSAEVEETTKSGILLTGSAKEKPQMSEVYIAEKSLGECDVTFPYQVPENAYFMMGDQRETSVDSRSSVIGCISKENTIGKILCKFWPLSEFEWLG